MNHKLEITGIILAGGKSSRMGTDKGVLHISGRPMIEHIIETLKQVTSRIIIIANNNNYGAYGFPVMPDLISNCGPMGGIYTGLQYSTTSLNLIISCDIPFIQLTTLNQLTNAPHNFDVIVPVLDGKTEPLCARYSKHCAPVFAKLLSDARYKMREALEGFNVLELNFPTASKLQFANINTKEELNQFNTVNHEC